MSQTYTNSLAEITESSHTAREWLNESGSYGSVTESIAIPAVADSEGRYRVELDHQVSVAQPVTVTVGGTVLTPVAYGTSPAANQYALCTSDAGAPIIEFHSSRAGQSGTAAYTPIGTMLTAGRMNALELASSRSHQQNTDTGTNALTFTVNSDGVTEEYYGFSVLDQNGYQQSLLYSTGYSEWQVVDDELNVAKLRANFVGSGANLDSLNATAIASGNLDAARLPTGGTWSLSAPLVTGGLTLNTADSGNDYKRVIVTAPDSGVNRYSLWVDQPSGGTTNFSAVLNGTVKFATAGTYPSYTTWTHATGSSTPVAMVYCDAGFRFIGTGNRYVGLTSGADISINKNTGETANISTTGGNAGISITPNGTGSVSLAGGTVKANNTTLGFYGATPVAKQTVTLGNTDNAIGGLSVGATYSQAEVQALRDKCEQLADDVRALKTALANLGLMA